MSLSGCSLGFETFRKNLTAEEIFRIIYLNEYYSS